MPNDKPSRPSFSELLRTFLYIGVNSFGGPAGQIAVMHRVLVDEKKWLSEQRFLHALNYCMLLPGPEAMQLATYAGWLLHGTVGGIVAGLLFVLPGALVMLGLSALYAGLHDVGWVAALFFGVKSAVVVVVVEALLRVSRRALRSRAHYALAVAAFCALYLFNVPFPIVILAAALLGLALPPPATAQSDGELAPHTTLSSPLRHIASTTLLWGAIWWLPIGAAYLCGNALLVSLGLFFSKAAMVTFGGAYSVLAFIAQQIVSRFHWLEAGQMMDGLGLAETTPGPLILVNQFAGFMAGFQHGNPAAPWLSGVLGALMATWTTFAPCFLWILLGAPFIEQLRGNKKLAASLGGITAAVVGVIANLSLWFALHTLFGNAEAVRVPGTVAYLPNLTTLHLDALLLTVAAAIAMFRFHVGMLKVLGACAVGGLVIHGFS